MQVVIWITVLGAGASQYLSYRTRLPLGRAIVPMWTADHLLFLAAVAAAILFLVGSEAFAALRSRALVPVRIRRQARPLPAETLHRIGLD
jgi:hypothetical protein